MITDHEDLSQNPLEARVNQILSMVSDYLSKPSYMTLDHDEEAGVRRFNEVDNFPEAKAISESAKRAVGNLWQEGEYAEGIRVLKEFLQNIDFSRLSPDETTMTRRFLLSEIGRYQEAHDLGPC